jgi:hypothetical protein
MELAEEGMVGERRSAGFERRREMEWNKMWVLCNFVYEVKIYPESPGSVPAFPLRF